MGEGGYSRTNLRGVLVVLGAIADEGAERVDGGGAHFGHGVGQVVSDLQESTPIITSNNASAQKTYTIIGDQTNRLPPSVVAVGPQTPHSNQQPQTQHRTLTQLAVRQQLHANRHVVVLSQRLLAGPKYDKINIARVKADPLCRATNALPSKFDCKREEIESGILVG